MAPEPERGERTSHLPMFTRTGIFLISLDFELAWGVKDRNRNGKYDACLIGTRSAIPRILNVFNAYTIHATWATVGLLLCEDIHEMTRYLPDKKPFYADKRLSPYSIMKDIGRDEREDPLHYALSLIHLIASFPHQEIGSHTFSHYYCLEEGQDITAFRSDLRAALHVARAKNLSISSLVFPRNQVNGDYVKVCRELGITAYRGTVPHWIYRKTNRTGGEILKRTFRLLDSYISISSHNCYSAASVATSAPYNLPASRFLRPFSRHLRLLDRASLRRITSSLTHAARAGLIYHLWWHPENFGCDIQENIDRLRFILDHYAALRVKYGMESLNMKEVAQRLALAGESESARCAHQP